MRQSPTTFERFGRQTGALIWRISSLHPLTKNLLTINCESKTNSPTTRPTLITVTYFQTNKVCLMKRPNSEASCK